MGVVKVIVLEHFTHSNLPVSMSSIWTKSLFFKVIHYINKVYEGK